MTLISPVTAPCNVIRGSGMTCHGIRPNIRHIGILHLVIFIFIELTCKRELALAVDWVGWYSEEGTQQAKNDNYLLIIVGDTGHSFATGYSKTTDHYTAKTW